MELLLITTDLVGTGIIQLFTKASHVNLARLALKSTDLQTLLEKPAQTSID